ncbi:MAG: hypothetical protein JSW18_04945 [Candidatus Omnitrophota bacterium]|nr:MAG: hypothetical protein JSW18_04945 [Candidatus Omnitrophota bacterium]
MRNKRKKKFIGSPAQKKLLILVFTSAVIPAGIVALCLYYLIFNLLAWQIGIPEAVAYNLIPVARKVNLIILIALPITLLAIWTIALGLSHRMLGPLSRLEGELDDIISDEKSGPIQLREKDVLKPLADKINMLINKFSSS